MNEWRLVKGERKKNGEMGGKGCKILKIMISRKIVGKFIKIVPLPLPINNNNNKISKS